MSLVVLYFSTTTTELTAKKSKDFSKILYVFKRSDRFCVGQFMPVGKYDNNNIVHVPFVCLYVFRYWAFMFGLCSIGIKTRAGGRNVHQYFSPQPSTTRAVTAIRRDSLASRVQTCVLRVPSTGPKNVSTVALHNHNNNNTLLLSWLSTAGHIIRCRIFNNKKITLKLLLGNRLGVRRGC